MKITQEEFIKAFNAAQKEHLMELEMTPVYRANLAKALQYESPINLGLSGREFKELYEKAESDELLNGYEFAILSNVIERRTMKELNLMPSVYFDLMLEAQSHSNEWNNLFIPVQQAIYDSAK